MTVSENPDLTCRVQSDSVFDTALGSGQHTDFEYLTLSPATLLGG
jgi:hypothetical protein